MTPTLQTIRADYDRYAAKDATTSTELFRLAAHIPRLLDEIERMKREPALPGLEESKCKH